MAASLSAYWVKFFKGAGFPLDVATKHAVVFSNNRIKPDMLPDLDKPSLKDMGIALMGDMIAILRYAKKVVEDTTCERFLVDTEDDKPPVVRQQQPLPARTIVKKAVAKVPSKTGPSAKPKIIQETILKSAKAPPASTVTKAPSVAKKKIVPSPRVVSQVVKESSQTPVKRKLLVAAKDDSESESEEEWVANTQKRLKLPPEVDNKVGYTVIISKGRTIRSQEITKKITDQKRTVFDRLGDSSVTSTTNLAEASPTFNITGLGTDVLKRNSSVFNRLGDKDAKKIERPQTGILKNGTPTSNAASAPQGILKSRPTSIGTTMITVKNSPVNKVTTKSTGTMHADHEKSQKTASSSVKQLVRTTKKIRLNDVAPTTTKTISKVATTSSKLASERVGSVPAKARLGLAGAGSTKQVTFDRVTKVAHIKKPGVFSRLGI